MEYEEFLEFVNGRRTLRAIKPDPIPDELVGKLLEAARWAPTGFNMQPLEMLVVKDLDLRLGIKKIVDDYKNSDSSRSRLRASMAGLPWPSRRMAGGLPPAPADIPVMETLPTGRPSYGGALLETERRLHLRVVSLERVMHGLPPTARACGATGSAVKYPKVQGLVKHLLNLPDFIYVYDIFLVGYNAMEGGPSAKLMRHLDEMVHHDRAVEDEFMSEEALRKEMVKLRAGNVARHVEAT
jgi:nitroreductase